MAENDDKLKDLKSRLGLVSGSGSKPAVSTRTTPAESEEKNTETTQVAAPAASASSPAPMAAPTREMSSDEMDAYDAEARVDVSVVAAGKKGPMIAICVVIAIAAFGIGQFMGGNTSDRAFIDSMNADKDALRSSLTRQHSDTGDTQLERIKKHITATTALAEKLQALPEGESEAAEKLLTGYLATCEQYEESIDFSGLLGRGFTAFKVVPEMMSLAIATVRYEERVKELARQGDLLKAMKSTRTERYDDPNFGRKKLFVQVGSAKISQPTGESIEVPMAWGEWIKGDISGFQEVPVEGATRRDPQTEWRTNAKLMDGKVPQLIPTAQVADVNMRMFLEPLDNGAYREVMASVVADVLTMEEYGKTLRLDRLMEFLNQ